MFGIIGTKSDGLEGHFRDRLIRVCLCQSLRTKSSLDLLKSVGSIKQAEYP